MEGFKSLPKMKAFREGGHAKREEYCGGGMAKKEGGKIAHEDIAEDKKLIKKAFKQHDKAKHEDSEPTEIKLKKGGRSKKDCGTVTKYKSGGGVATEKGKPSGDKDATKKVPPTGDKKADAPSKGAEKAPAGKAEFFKRGGVKKFNGGGLSNPMMGDSGASPFQTVNAQFGPNAPQTPPLVHAQEVQQNMPTALRRGGKVK